MRPFYACGSPEHSLSRRRFLTGTLGAAGLMGLGQLLHPINAKQLANQDKRVLLIFLSGGVSQLETWDPKPGTPTGGPFLAINTNVPGIQISELLPFSAQHMDKLALVRSINTAENEHSRGAYFMQTGRRQNPAEPYPHLGSVMAKLLASDDNPMPGFIHISPGGGSGSFNRQDAAFLGPQYASVSLPDGNPPANLTSPATVTAQLEAQGADLLNQLNSNFQEGRRTADTEAYTSSYDQAAQVMQQSNVFDITREPVALRERYGTHDFGRHCLLARRLLENGVTFVKVTHSNYDTHYENFEFHIEQLGEFDRTFATLLDDLSDRGMLEKTLVIVMSEFGRTPNINRGLGRDHWSAAWSVAMAGCGIRGGTAVGRTNPGGTAVVERQVSAGHLFHTYFRALGLDPTRNHYVDNRPIPMADPAASAIEEVLA
jgi:uncharacterized protein (DUF1501 family)